MSADRIELRGLRLVGRIGVLPEERDRDQPLEIDVDAELDLMPSGSSDDLGDTVDYGALCDSIATIVGSGHVALLERLAEVLAQAVLASDDRVEAATVSVRKLRPPVPYQLATSGVRVTRTR
jgi:dihydroneopterin aldolase